ncbi:hypothetical protein, partial [Bowmanella yangjiangensis]
YLAQGRHDLEDLTESHIRLLASGGLIDHDLLDAALGQRLVYRDWQLEPNLRVQENDKGISVARSRLSNLLGMPFYDLDRLDLAASSTLQYDLQQQVSH